MYLNLPPDVARIIASQSPPAYRSLAQTSPLVYQSVKPILKKICEAPISATEIAKFIADRGEKGYIALRGPQEQKVFPSREEVGYSVSGRNFDTLAEFIPAIDRYLYLGYRPDSLVDVFIILRQRKSCRSIDPKYAYRRTIALERERIQREYRRGANFTAEIIEPLRRLMMRLSYQIGQNYSVFERTLAGLPDDVTIDRILIYLTELETSL